MRFAWCMLLCAVTCFADDTNSLRLAIEDLTKTGNYPRGAEFLQRLDTVKTDAEFRALQREALIANPLVSGQPILFVVRPQYRSSYHAIDTLFHTGEANTGNFEGGGALKLIDFANGGSTKTLLDVPQGIARDPEVHSAGRRSCSPSAATSARTITSGRSTPTCRFATIDQRARRVRLRSALSVG